MSEQLIFNIDDELYSLRGGRLSEINNVSDVTGDKWVISDFQGAAPQVLRVDAPVKYAEPVMERRLRQLGELAGAGRVLCHFKRKVTSNMSEAFITAVSADVFNAFEVAAENDNNSTLLFSTNALIMSALKKLKPKKPAAILFAHGSHVDLAVGDSGNVYGAARVSTYGEEGDTEELRDNVVNAIRTIEQDKQISVTQVHLYHWMVRDTRSIEWVRDAAKQLDASCYIAAPEKLAVGDVTYFSSAPYLARRLTIADSASNDQQKNNYRAQKAMPWMAFGLIAATVLLAVVTFNWKMKTAGVENEIRITQTGISQNMPSMRAAENSASNDRGLAVLKAAYEKPLSMTDGLYWANLTPPIQSVLGQISQAAKGKIVFNELGIHYPKGKVVLSLNGQVSRTFENGISHYNSFIASLAGFGYRLTESEVQNKAQGLAIKLKLEKKINEK